MKKTKYNLFLVRGTIDAIKQLAKSYDIELIETNFWGDIYYEFETDPNESTPILLSVKFLRMNMWL